MSALLFELMKDSKRSDRNLAKILRVSQPTVTRRRKKLEEMGVIKEYTLMPDWTQLGIEIMAITLLNMSREPSEEDEAYEWIRRNPNIVFASRGQGAGANTTLISLHENYTSFSEFISQLRRIWHKYVQNMRSFLVSTKAKPIKEFSFRHLEKMKTT